MCARLLGVAFGMIAANYLYQLFGAGDWQAATERSFFQAAALAAVAVSLWVRPEITR